MAMFTKIRFKDCVRPKRSITFEDCTNENEIK
jgi:hypothetical protein